MPLLKRKPFALLPPPAIDRKNKTSKNCPVWYQPLTKEIFLDYSDYLERTSLYKRPLWDCESTGRSNLTYAEALESERGRGKPKVPKNNLPEALQKAVLQRAQFQNARLDAVVDNLHDYFVNRYMSDENVECLWDDGILYTAKILEAPPLEYQTSDEVEYKVQLLDENYEGLEEYIKNMHRKDIKRGRLAFSKSMLKRFLRDATTKENYMGAPWNVNDEFAKRLSIDTTLPKDLEAAKALAYSKSRKLRSLASASSLVPTAQSRLEEARKLESLMKYPMEDLDLPAYRRNLPSADSPQLFLDMGPGSGNELKMVPNPTGDFPIRPLPSHESVASDCFGTFLMVWSFLNVFSRPLHLSAFSLNDFESALRHTSKCEMDYEVVVALMNCIIRHRLKPGYQPLSLPETPSSNGTSTGYTSTSLPMASSRGTKNYAFPINNPSTNDNGENDNATLGKSTQQKQQQQQVNGYKVDMNGIQLKDHHVSLDRGCASDEVISIGKNWDARPIPRGNDRRGWEDVMIGCINDLAIESDENMAAYDAILCGLVPRLHSTLEQREQAYLKLGLKEKLTILQLLVHAANETSDIKDYMEECQEQLTELRKQKIEINRERRRIQAERNELEKQEDEAAAEASDSGNDSDIDSSNSDNVDQVQKEVSQISRHESRQEIMRRKQLEREEMEVKRKKLYHQQRQQARDKNRELKIRAMARNKLEKEEQQVQKKYDQVNRDMRKYNTLRFKPLGRDKFYNRYYYLDNIGSGYSHGSGKLFVQSPSVEDLCVLLADNDNTKKITLTATPIKDIPAASPTTTTATAATAAAAAAAATTKATSASSPTTVQATPVTSPTETTEPDEKTSKPNDSNSITSKCGHGGGVSFICQLMEHQGLSDKVSFLKDDIDRMINSEYLEWWESFDDSEALDELLAWLNPKGVREYCLKKELQKHLVELLAGMKKHTTDRSAPMAQVTRRSTRTMKHSPTFSEPWLTYTNKLAK